MGAQFHMRALASNPVVAGYDGVIAVNSAGRLVNGTGAPIQLRGANFSGLEGSAASGYWDNNAWGDFSQVGGGIQTGRNGPDFPVYASWRPNFVRFLIHAGSFLGVNQFLLSPAGSASAPQWLTATVSSSVTSSTVIPVNSTTYWDNGQQPGCMITDVTGGSTIPTGTKVSVASSTQLTATTAVTIPSGTTLYATYLADPTSIYRSTLATAIETARANKLYIEINCHINAPRLTIGGVTQWMCALGQLQFIDDDTAQAYWVNSSTSLVAWLATTFGSAEFNAANGFNGGAAGTQWSAAYGGYSGFGDIIFELFNEPYYGNQPQTLTALGGGSVASNEAAYLNGCYASFICNNGGEINTVGIGIPSSYAVGGTTGAVSADFASGSVNGCKMGGYQEILNGIRAQGATNVCLVAGDNYASKQSTIYKLFPADTLSPSQVGTNWHGYQSGTSDYPNTGDPGSGTAACLAYPQANIAGTGGIGFPIPLVYDEFASNGGCGTSQTQPNAFLAAMLAWVDTYGVHTAYFAWSSPAPNGTAGPDNWTACELGASFTFTATVSNGSGAAGNILDVTAVTGSPFQIGTLITVDNSGNVLTGAYIASFGTGTGGTGTYFLNQSNVQLGSTSMSAAQVLPLTGDGQTLYNWMYAHA